MLNFCFLCKKIYHRKDAKSAKKKIYNL